MVLASAVFFILLAVIKRGQRPNPRGYNRVDTGHDSDMELSMLSNVDDDDDDDDFWLE